MTYRVRRATGGGDLRAIAKLDQAIFVFLGDDPLTETELAETAWWLAEKGGVPVAFAGARYLESDNLVYFVRAGVLRTHRGHGLQRRLIDVRTRWARTRGADGAITYTVQSNYASANNLIAQGFRLYWPECAWVGYEVLYWMRKLA